jgi:hypothetical protein
MLNDWPILADKLEQGSSRVDIVSYLRNHFLISLRQFQYHIIICLGDTLVNEHKTTNPSF